MPIASLTALSRQRLGALRTPARTGFLYGWCRLLLSGGSWHSAVMAESMLPRRIDSHLHVWTPDIEKFPSANAPPEHLNKDGFASYERFVSLMDDSGVESAVLVQPVNYGQDYSYLVQAMNDYPGRLRGVFVADPTVGADKAGEWMESLVRSHPGWVGVRFNPYKWPEGSPHGMADDVGVALFRKAGELGLPVGFMPFKGLSRHIKEIEALLASSPTTKVIIDHWGFFLQPATGFGERSVDDESWKALLTLAEKPQVYVKLSAFFRVSADKVPWVQLGDRLQVLLKSFGSSRMLWGSDFPYVAEHCSYPEAVRAMDSWAFWSELPDADKENIYFGTVSRLYPSLIKPNEGDEANMQKTEDSELRL